MKKLDPEKMAREAMHNMRASIEILSAVETLRKYAPPDDDDEPIAVRVIPTKAQALIPDGRKQRKKAKFSPARRAALRKHVKKTLRWNKAHRELCEYCNNKIDPRAIKRHRIACKKKHKGKLAVHPVAEQTQIAS